MQRAGRKTGKGNPIAASWAGKVVNNPEEVSKQAYSRQYIVL